MVLTGYYAGCRGKVPSSKGSEANLDKPLPNRRETHKNNERIHTVSVPEKRWLVSLASRG